MILGSHVGMSGKEMLLGSAKEAVSYGADTFMFYTGAPQNTRRKEISELNIGPAWEYMKANEAQIYAIKDQVKANAIALDGVQKEEALGNRTVLDVLDAYQELLNSNVNEVTARRDYYVSAMQLLVAMGKLTAKELSLDVKLYDAKKFYKETRDKWLSLN